VDKILCQNQFLALIDRDGYSFVREVRCDGRIVSILPFRTRDNTKEFLSRLEVCPAHGPEIARYSFTGGWDPKETIEETAVRELREEAGFFIDRDELVGLGQTRPSKSADTTAYLFAVDVTGKRQFRPEGDGSRFEATASVEWVNYEVGIQTQDPLFLSAILRLNARESHGISRYKS